MKNFHPYFAAAALLLCASCNGLHTESSRGPIVLGDSTTIVTEKDSAYLRDMVSDIGPGDTPPEPVRAAAAIPEKILPDTAKKTGIKPSTQENGFTIDFGGPRAVFTGITAKEYQKQNPERDNGVSYARTSGNLAKSTLVVYGLTNVTLKQRYQSDMYLESSLGKLDLNMGAYLSDWTPLNGTSASGAVRYALKELSQPDYKSFSAATLKAAITKAARRGRLNRTVLNKWLSSIRHTRNAHDTPCKITLHNVQWQLSGTDRNGKRFFKTIRMDN